MSFLNISAILCLFVLLIIPSSQGRELEACIYGAAELITIGMNTKEEK